MLAQAYGYAGQKEKVLPLLEKADAAGIYLCPYESAAAYLSIGDKERAMACSMRPSPSAQTASSLFAMIPAWSPSGRITASHSY
jgi:hypothetical protein